MSKEAPTGLIRFGVFEVDTRAGELRRSGSRIRLRNQPFQVLVLLLDDPGSIVTRERLQSEIWPEGTFVDFDRGLNKAVNHLRDALGDSAENPRFIETVPKRGYRFIAPVERSAPAPGASRPQEAAQAAAPGRPKIWWLAPAALAIPLAIWTMLLYQRNMHSPAGRHQIVLASFTNLTGDPAFDLTLRQALEIDLAQSPFLKILSDQQVRDTVGLMERGGDQPLTRQLAREVCLRTGGKGILNSLDRAASGIRTKLGESLDSIRRFDRPLTDFVSTSLLEAFQAYVRGQQAVQERGRVDGIPFYRHAAELDPNFALAHLQLGILYGFLGETAAIHGAHSTGV